MPVSEAICPAGISSFFEVCRADSEGNLISDPDRIGARGGGFGIDKHIHARVVARRARKNQIEIRINSKPSPEAHTTRWALSHILKSSCGSFWVRANIKVEVPIGAGYGTSAAGTAAACLALSDALGLPMTYGDIGRITHVAEVVNGTGLGTAGALLLGGFVLVKEPGAPGIGMVDRLMFPEGHSILCVYLGRIPTRDILSRPDIAKKVNPAARHTMKAILQQPNLQTFLTEAGKFSRKVGFQTPDVARAIDILVSNGAVGAAQNMLGKAVHAVAENYKIRRLTKAILEALPSASVFSAGLDERGVRFVERTSTKRASRRI